MTEHKVIGRSVDKYDGLDKVTGKARYASDLNQDSLYGVALRSPVHHARITRLDASRALGMPGVIGVVTAADVPGKPLYGRLIQDRPVLASDVVLHIGEPVALVVARSAGQAEKAAAAIQLEFELLPAVHDVTQSILETAPRLHPDGNVALETKIESGDIDAGFREADVTVEAVLQTPRVSPAYLETEAAVAEWHPDGRLTVQLGSQTPFIERDLISGALGLPKENVVIQVPPIGGSFGGKCEGDLSILAALAAMKVKGRVRMVNSREESMLGHTKRHPAHMHYRLGAKSDGTLTALQADILLDSGAFAPNAPAVGSIVAEMGIGPYRIPHVRMRTRNVYTNSPPSGAIRSAGGAQATFGIERMMDLLAEKLAMDPIALRRRNAWRQGDRTAFGVNLRREPPLQACLERAALACSELRAKPCPPGRLCGVGVATSLLKMGLGYRVADDSTNRVEWKADGGVLVHLGASDLGQGLMTVSAQLVAESLGVGYGQVEIKPLDTATSPDGGPTLTSRTTFLVGNSLVEASRRAVDALLQYASDVLKAPMAELAWRDGMVVHTSQNGTTSLPAAYFSSRAAEEDRRLLGEATASFPNPDDLPDTYRTGMPHSMFIYGAQVARVEIDPQLGSVSVTHLVSIHQVGRVIHPGALEGQVEGGAAMGLGYALMEEMKVKANGAWTDNFMEYILPSMDDMPEITPVLLEDPDPQGPFGAVGAGESVTVATAPAILNAVRDATGHQFLQIPLAPEALIRELDRRGTARP